MDKTQRDKIFESIKELKDVSDQIVDLSGFVYTIGGIAQGFDAPGVFDLSCIFNDIAEKIESISGALETKQLALKKLI